MNRTLFLVKKKQTNHNQRYRCAYDKIGQPVDKYGYTRCFTSCSRWKQLSRYHPRHRTSKIKLFKNDKNFSLCQVRDKRVPGPIEKNVT